MSEIKPGDMVVMIKQHCDAAVTNDLRFRPFIVRSIGIMDGAMVPVCNACKQPVPEFIGTKCVLISDWMDETPLAPGPPNRTRVLPMSYLKKIEPPGMSITEQDEEKIAA